MSDASLRRLELQVDRTNQHWRKGRTFLLAVSGFIMLVAGIRQIWFLVAIGGVMFLAFLAMAQAMIAKTNWQTNPIFRILRERPQDITGVKHVVASSSSGAFQHSFFVLEVETGKSASLRVPDADKEAITQVLRERCPNATFTGPGFDS